MLEALSRPAPKRRNEDAFIAYQRDDGQPQYVIAALDGATDVATFAPLRFYLQRHHNGITPAALAASLARDAMLEMLGNLNSNDDIDPKRLILHANERLREFLEDVTPEIFDAAEIARLQPEDAPQMSDPRRIRLFLPATVLTVATIDTELKLLRFAHAGDSGLLVCYADGHVEVPTRDKQRRVNYNSALAIASRTALKTDTTLQDTVRDPFVRSLQRDHRIYHNYVDEEGNPVPSQGIGVVNGLPEVADYTRTGMVYLEGVQAVLVASDGFAWPAPLHEDEPAYQQRIAMMWWRIQQDGLRGYYRALRHEERQDAAREKYPRFKLHDDATAVLLWLSL
jgi:hypothetical protein